MWYRFLLSLSVLLYMHVPLLAILELILSTVVLKPLENKIEPHVNIHIIYLFVDSGKSAVWRNGMGYAGLCCMLYLRCSKRLSFYWRKVNNLEFPLQMQPCNELWLIISTVCGAQLPDNWGSIFDYRKNFM